MDDETQQLIEDCEARESRLTDWERGFVDSIKGQLAGGGSLTKLQAEKLGEVWDRVTAKG
jgi:hypothetical protein